MNNVRRAVRHKIHALVGFEEGSPGIERPPGDPGLFGPGSATWVVHGDFTAMMAGGVAALLLQMLHPAALAGVWDYSNFRTDPVGRLRRTAQFVAGTTYGGTEMAERLIGRVRAIHARVAGTLPDGTAYAASDPALLAWVHAAEATCFLAAHLRYRDPLFSAAMQDRYLAETAGLAERLGAADVPRSRRELAAYMERIRPQLGADERTRAVADAILSAPAGSDPASRAGRLFREAGVDLLPPWAARLHGRPVDPLRRPAIRAGLRGTGTFIRWAMQKAD